MISAIYKDINDNINKYVFCTVDFIPKDDADYKLILKTTELDMIMSFAKLIKHYRPDIITGFNDYKFDWYVIINRLIELDNESTGVYITEFYKSIDILYDQRIIKDGIIEMANKTQIYKKNNPGLPKYCQFLNVQNCQLFKSRRMKLTAIDISEEIPLPVFESFMAIDTMLLCHKLIKLDTTARGLDAYSQQIGHKKNDLSYFVQLQIFTYGQYQMSDG
jgi:hypothetical protein